MQDVSIKEIRDLIKFSGIEIEATKRGSGFIHLFAKNISDLTNFRGVCIVNEIVVSVSTAENFDGSAYGVVSGRVRQEVNA